MTEAEAVALVALVDVFAVLLLLLVLIALPPRHDPADQTCRPTRTTICQEVPR